MKTNMTVLYIEDNMDDVMMISDILSKDNGIEFNLKSVPNLQDGIKALSNASFDVILLDLGLPDSFGLEAVTKISNLKKNIPIIVLTVNSDRAVGIKALQMGAQDYLIKEQIGEHLIAKSIQYANVRSVLSEKETTLRQKAEDELDEISNRLLLATKAANIGIWDYTISTGKLIWDNRMHELYGIKQGEFSGDYELWESKLHPKDKLHAIHQLELALSGEKEFNTEFRIIASEETTLYIKAMGLVKRDRKGKALKVIGTNWDITKEKTAELKAIQIEKDKAKEAEQFAYIASHDLQEPLRTIQSFTDFFIEDYGHLVDKDGTYVLNTINESSKRMRNLIKGLLSYSKIGKGGIISTINVNQILKETCKDLTLILEQQKAVIEITGEMPLIEGYELQIRQLFINLITNAIKFTRVDISPVIKIKAKEYKNYWQFTIEDNGIGIEAQHLDKIFEIFKRLHNDKEFEGTGIGLAYCKKITELHQGKIWVKSVLNQGSSFHFTISKTIKKQIDNYEYEAQLHNAH